MTIKTAVFPVAGLGTRFLPATKANPKEMLPIVDKPLIQYAVEEAVFAGVTELIFVTSHTKRSIEDHFDSNYELEARLEKANKQSLLDTVRGILPKGVSCAYIRQPEALGLGHAVLCAAPLVRDQSFAVILADDLIYDDKTPCLKSMVDLVNNDPDNRNSVIAVEQVNPSQVSSYGVIDPVATSEDNVHKVKGIVEKPAVDAAPSNLAVVGRYILSPRIFHHLTQLGSGAGGEIQLTDAIATLLKEETVLGYSFSGLRYDCGSKLGYLNATVEYALRHPELKDSFADYLIETAKSLKS